jgi:hypothetical protein
LRSQPEMQYIRFLEPLSRSQVMSSETSSVMGGGEKIWCDHSLYHSWCTQHKTI